MPNPSNETPGSLEAKLDEIVLHLRKMDARDKMRMWGGFIRSMIAIIPVLFFIWSAWYIYEHGDELMKMIANQAASSAAEYTKNQGQDLVDQMMKGYEIPGR